MICTYEYVKFMTLHYGFKNDRQTLNVSITSRRSMILSWLSLSTKQNAHRIIVQIILNIISFFEIVG